MAPKTSCRFDHNNNHQLFNVHFWTGAFYLSLFSATCYQFFADHIFTSIHLLCGSTLRLFSLGPQGTTLYFHLCGSCLVTCHAQLPVADLSQARKGGLPIYSRMRPESIFVIINQYYLLQNLISSTYICKPRSNITQSP